MPGHEHSIKLNCDLLVLSIVTCKVGDIFFSPLSNNIFSEKDCPLFIFLLVYFICCPTKTTQ